METNCMTKKESLCFLDECNKRKYFIFGVERFICNKEGKTPDINGIADFSSLVITEVELSIIAAQSFLSEYGDNLFERFVITYQEPIEGRLN